jgi:dTDP-glucose 4,6-dehydratase
MTIIVTGGAGFIGTNFVLQWLAETTEPVCVLDKLTYAGNLHNLDKVKSNPSFEFVRADIGDLDVVRPLLGRIKPRAIINFAAESHVDRSITGPAEFVQTNIVSTFKLIEMCRAYWEDLASGEKEAFRFLHVSTDEVYGSLSATDPAFTEENAFKPNSPYSASKASSDHLVRATHHTYGLPVLTTNCSNNYGPYQFPEKLVPLMIHRAITGDKLPVYGDGLNVRDWLYVTDHCHAVRAVLADGVPGETYNIGGWNEKTNIEVVHTICNILDREKPRADGKSYRDQIAFVKDRLGHDRRYAVDSSKIANTLGWKPTETFETGIDRTVKWYLANEAWIDAVTSGTYRS